MPEVDWVLINKKKDSFNKIDKVKSIACLLAYFNGAKYIRDQIQSIIDQKTNNLNISLFISDDNSKEIFPSLEKLNLKNLNNINIFYRKLKKNIGYANNFLFSLKDINLKFDYFCFSDQDDIWLENKIATAVKTIEKYPKDISFLYGGRTSYFDQECNQKLGDSILVKKALSFRNAIIQNIVGGNTMLLNNAARNIIIKTINNNLNTVSHDWWCYQIISGSGGITYYEKLSFVKYRQHSMNLLGANNSLKARLLRINNLLNGKFRIWNDANLKNLKNNINLLTKENQKILIDFAKCREASFFKRIILFQSIGIYRQTIAGNLALYLAIIIKRL